MLRSVFTAVTLTAAAAVAISAYAQVLPTPQDQAITAVETRQAVFKLLGYNMAPITAMSRGEMEFDAELAERNALRIQALAPMIVELFEALDTREFNVHTRALPGIWDNMDEFRELAGNLETAAATFAETAAGGDRMQTIGAVRAFGSSCGNCHEPYRD